MRTVTIEKNGSNYVVNPKASSGGPLNMFDSTIPCYIPRDNPYHNSPTIILILPDGTPTTADNISQVTKILCTGEVGGYQILYYIDNDGGIKDVPGFEDASAYDVESFRFENGVFYYTREGESENYINNAPAVFAEVNLFTIMMSGYYGG